LFMKHRSESASESVWQGEALVSTGGMFAATC
jgi:hypothetical protein